jgi:hypothetical protein
MDQTRKNIRSTRTTTANPTDIATSSITPTQETNNPITNNIFASITDAGKIYIDQTGRFLVTSSQGHQYILVLYDYDTNAILTEPLKK